MGKVGVNINGVRGYKPEDVLSIIERMAQLGYEGIELFRYKTIPAREIRKALDDNGIAASSSRGPYEEVLQNPEGVMDYALETGASYIVIPRLPEDMRNEAGCRKAMEALRPAAEKYQKNGIHLAYQNHDWELVSHNGKCAMDLMAEIMPPGLLVFQVENYFFEDLGIDILGFIKKYRKYCRKIHLGDKKPQGIAEYCDLGTGTVNIPALVQVCEETGVDWYDIQQEHYHDDMFVTLGRNGDYLREVIRRAH